jgi:hypothetical protein
MSKRLLPVAMLLGAALASTACVELQVDNPNQPDRERALSQPSDVEMLIGTSFIRYFGGIHGFAVRLDYPAFLLPAVGNEATTHIYYGGAVENADIPRVRLRNDPSMPAEVDPQGPLLLWRRFNEVVSSANEGLDAIESGMKFTEAGQDVTMRAKAFAKFTQGLAWGQMALAWDQVPLTDEFDLPLPGGQDALYALTLERMKPYPEAMARAIRSLDEAIAIAQQNTFTLPSTWTRNAGGPVTNVDLVRIANSHVAKFMVYNARTPEERAQVDWGEVLKRTASGVTSDFGPQRGAGEEAVRSGFWEVMERNTQGCVNCHRFHYDVIGPADISGTYQQWLNTPLEDRNRFNIVTPDRRVTGPTPTSNGAYVRWLADNNGFWEARGRWAFSAYQWYRATGGQLTAIPVMSVDENNLIRAEALYRTGDLAGAAALVNVSRTRQQRIGTATYDGLPPVTAAGVPQSGDCVPRTSTGACGNLWDALVYERRLELSGVDIIRAFADNRGLGLLPAGTWLHMPIPGRELQTLRQQNYSYGGVGGNCSVGSTCVIGQR